MLTPVAGTVLSLITIHDNSVTKEHWRKLAASGELHLSETGKARIACADRQ
jgi:hypothetical protein